jgi:hypothetical protein
MIEDFGIIIACCDQDYIFAKACCASVRYFMGDVPICLIVDGELNTSTLERIYGVKVINQKNVSSDVLRKRSFGFGLTKMVAFWESPWKNFLYLDADTIAWFDLLKYANFKDFDAIIDQSSYLHSNEDICSYFFDISKIGKYFPDFDWEAHRHHYFCTGVFFASRGIFDLDDYAEILNLMSHEPRLFLLGEQGMLNFMFCRAADNGRIRLGQESIQLIVPDSDRQKLQENFRFDHAEPCYSGKDVVIHWCGPNKPTFESAHVYSKPMTFFRQKFIQDANREHSQTQASSDQASVHSLIGSMQLRSEDFQHYMMKYKNKMLRKLRIKQKIHT